MKFDSLDYLRIAEDCLKKAFAATDDVIRAQWTQLADRWRTLAARIAECERVMAEYEQWRVSMLNDELAIHAFCRVEQVKN